MRFSVFCIVSMLSMNLMASQVTHLIMTKDLGNVAELKACILQIEGTIGKHNVFEKDIMGLGFFAIIPVALSNEAVKSQVEQISCVDYLEENLEKSQQ